MGDYGQYIDDVTQDIVSTVEEMKCQPIIFAGSGLPIRYIDGPGWKELLLQMEQEGPDMDKSVNFYLQRNMDEPEIGTKLADAYQEWAWNGGSSNYSDEYRDPDYDSDIFLKKSISDYLMDKVTDFPDNINDSRHKEEIKLLNNIQPHAIITTNYDTMLEEIFPEHEPIIGDTILRSPHENFGEIMKIHGCVSEPDEMVLTAEDYVGFNENKKYLSAKLLTYFAEHPVLFVGYDIGDDNIRNILSDIDQVLALNEDVIENIYFLEWDDAISERESFPQEKEIEVANGDTIRVKYIVAEYFDWVFDAFGSGGYIEDVNLKLLRSVMANTYDIVRERAPREEVSINFRMLEQAASSEDTLGTLFGVTALDRAPSPNFTHPYRATEVAEQLGYSHYNHIRDLFSEVEEELGESIKDSNNKYHVDITPQASYPDHRYSQAAIDLLRKVDRGEDYELEEISTYSALQAQA